MGERFGQYELLEPLASGGMARVFRARMVGAMGFEKIVAIKFMLPNFAADPVAVKMFVDEARLAATLSHANIIGILDFGERDGAYFIAMEYVAGANLRVLLRRAHETNRWPSRALAALIAQEAARGLDYAHKKTDADGRPLFIVHRDVSPQNVVVSWTGEVKILDFGIARSRQRSTETEAGTIKGKYSYMSPEQAAGSPVDHRSDIFSLGSVLYELLCWERAFPQPGPNCLPKVRAADFVAPEKLKPDLPPRLLHVLHRAMALDPGNRYATAGEMMDDLSLWLAEERMRPGATQSDGNAHALARWAEDLFSVSDNDFPSKKKSAEPGVLPGWEAEKPAETKHLRVDLTFSGEASEEDVDLPPDPVPVSVSPRTLELEPAVPRMPEKTAPSRVVPQEKREIPAFAPIPRPPPKTTPSAPAVEPEPSRRNAIVFAAGAALALLLLTIGGVYVAIDGARPTPTPIAIVSATPTATATVAPTATPEPTARMTILGIAPAGTEPVGILNLSSVPAGAVVWIDGKQIDRSPTVVPDVPAPKRYLVEMRKEGYADWSREVDVVDDTVVVVEAALAPPEVPGKIRFRVPAGITAYVDGRRVGTGPGHVDVEAQPGPHQVRLRNGNDFLLRQYELLVTSGRTSELDIPPVL